MTDDVIQTPAIVAFVVCDLVILDRDTNKRSLIGMFDRIRAMNVPCVHSEMHVFVAVSDGRGRVPATLSLKKADDERVLFEARGAIEFNDPLAVVELHFPLHNTQFPDFGLYIFEFAAHGVPIGTRKFRVERAEPRA
jgi:hypothetical protein